MWDPSQWHYNKYLINSQELDFSSLYESAWTNIMKHYRVDDLNNRSLFFYSSEELEVGDQGDIMVRFSWEFSPESLQLIVFLQNLHLAKKERERKRRDGGREGRQRQSESTSSDFSSKRLLIQSSDQDPTFVFLSSLNYFFRTRFPNISTWGLGHQPKNWRWGWRDGTQFSPQQSWYMK